MIPHCGLRSDETGRSGEHPVVQSLAEEVRIEAQSGQERSESRFGTVRDWKVTNCTKTTRRAPPGTQEGPRPEILTFLSQHFGT